MPFQRQPAATAPHTDKPERLLPLVEVEQLTGIKKTTVYHLIRLGEFPPPIRLTRRASRWPASHVQAWIAERIKAGGV